MFVHAHLGWLVGFPEVTDAGLRWHRLDGTPPFLVESALISRARRAQKTLVSDHGDALETVVGDVAHWGAAVDAVLTAVSHALRSGVTPAAPIAILPANVRRLHTQLRAAHPELVEVIDAAVIAMLARPAQLATTLRWLDSRGAMVASVIGAQAGPRGVLAVLRLAAFADEHGAGLVDPLLALAGIDAPLPGSVIDYAKSVDQLLRTLTVGGSIAALAKPVPPKTSTSPIVDWIARLATVDDAARKRVLTVLEVVDLATPLERVGRWWRRSQPQLERGEAVARGSSRDKDYLQANLDAVAATNKDVPPAFDLFAYLAVIEQAAWHGFAPHLPALVRLLELVPTTLGPLARMRLCDELRDDAEVAGERKQAWLWDALAEEIENGAAPERMLSPWRAAIDGSGGCYAQPIRRSVVSKADAKRVAAIMAACAAKGEITYAIIDRAMAFVPTALAPALVAEVIEGAAKVNGYFDVAQVRAAVALGGEAVKELVAALAIITAICDELPARTTGEVAAFVEHARAAGGTWVLRRILDEKKSRIIVDAAATAAVVAQKSWPPLVRDTRGMRWLDGYPPELRGALTRLAAADADAEVTVRRILRRDLPHPEDAAKELTALRAGRHKSPSAVGRLARLERGSRTPGAVRLARLAERIERVAAHIAIDRFSAAVTVLATMAIAEGCGLDAWPGWPLDRQRVAVLTGLTKLPDASRALAMRLLRKRAGARPWDLRDDPRNQAFLAGLRDRGIDPAPWLDEPARVVTAADGTALTVGFAADPLDVFVMGEHFNTCLGADGVNFFSVVTNAADINKRVLYAHRADGKVAGRCLFALTDGGRILTFEPYAHDGKLEFGRIVRDRALDLAARMRTEVVGSGNVSTLVADEWYDDGAHDLVERFPALAGESDLRKELATIAPAALAARLTEALAHALDDVTLPLVVGLPEVQRRPELVLGLGAALLAATAIPDNTMIHASRLALAAGDHAMANRLLAGRARPQMMIDTPRWIGDLLAKLRPSQALALLRQTRERGVRDWVDEPVERIVVAATAMEHLRRPHQAADLYRVAIRRGWQSLVQELKPRLAAIEARSA
ncbi:MAG TPA: hypothetical protein VM261_37340 [Kofleriaceae bacterium]|nr:hypothetical protein [Kofleriaceae bacterium]